MADKKDVTIVWKETNDGVNWQDLAELLNRAFDHPNEPVNKPGYRKPAAAGASGTESANHVRPASADAEPVNSTEYPDRAETGKKPEKDDGHHRTAESVEKVFRNSYGVVYAYDGSRLIACGRVLSDGLEQAAIYNIAVDPDYQGYGLGRGVIERLLEQVKGCETILYTHPQTVKFYETLGWRRMKTGFVTHPGGSFSDFEIEEGFILPVGYRYEKDESEYYEVPPEHEEQF